jgi:hypothetical protein
VNYLNNIFLPRINLLNTQQDQRADSYTQQVGGKTRQSGIKTCFPSTEANCL